jgi:RNA polymerase sigma factor (sigma-70 family)
VKPPLEDIIHGCRHGLRQAQKQLFEYLAASLLTVSRQYTPKTSDPLDNLQDSFIKIFERIHSFDVNKGSLESWARRIVINTALDKLNKKGIEEVVLEYEHLPEILECKIKDIEDIEQLMHIISQLPDGYKQVFCLYEIEGYSHKEIAEQLKIKEATSRSQLNKSKQLLRSWVIKMDLPVFLNIQSE